MTNKENTFQVALPSQKLFFQASGEKNKLEWMQAIAETIDPGSSQLVVEMASGKWIPEEHKSVQSEDLLDEWIDLQCEHEKPPREECKPKVEEREVKKEEKVGDGSERELLRKAKEERDTLKSRTMFLRGTDFSKERVEFLYLNYKCFDLQSEDYDDEEDDHFSKEGIAGNFRNNKFVQKQNLIFP